MRPLALNGFEAWSEVIARDYEGLIAKDEASLSEAGPTRRMAEGEAERLGPSPKIGAAPEPAFGVTASSSRGRLRSRYPPLLSSSSPYGQQLLGLGGASRRSPGFGCQAAASALPCARCSGLMTLSAAASWAA